MDMYLGPGYNHAAMQQWPADLRHTVWKTHWAPKSTAGAYVASSNGDLRNVDQIPARTGATEGRAAADISKLALHML